MPATSNADRLADDLRKLVLSFGFGATIEGKSLGRDCAGTAADGIAARSIDRQSGPDGPWPANEAKYADRKRRLYNSDLVGVRTGQMLSIESLIGGTVVTTHEVQMQYGTGEAPTRSYASAHFDPATDGAISDIEKALIFSARRPFYFLDDDIADAVFARVSECLDQYLVQAR